MLKSQQTTASAAAEMAYNKARPPLPDFWPAPLVSLITSCWSGRAEDRPAFSSILAALTENQNLTVPLAYAAYGDAGEARFLVRVVLKVHMLPDLWVHRNRRWGTTSTRGSRRSRPTSTTASGRSRGYGATKKKKRKRRRRC